MLYDVFICHASEDKESFVRPLAEALRKNNIEVWYDEFSLTLGDSIRKTIDKGLLQSRFGVVVLSKAFFSKNWPQYELDGLVEREMAGNDKVILPVWYNITHDEVLTHSASLAGRKAATSSAGLEAVVKDILSVIHPQGSPLIEARDILLDWGVTPPVITDRYWLDIVEASNRLNGFGAAVPQESVWGRWSFPLPKKNGDKDGWGQRLAWTAMQFNWVKAAENIPITPLTEPSIVHEFIANHNGLFETCQDYSPLLIEYAPQLTIHGMSGRFEELFEKEYKESILECKEKRRRKDIGGSGLTTDHKAPLCDEEWALRHPKFGNYEPKFVSSEYFGGGMFGPQVSPFEHADHLFWLFSECSNWLPKKIHNCLLTGMFSLNWNWDNQMSEVDENWITKGALSEALYSAALSKKKKFEWDEHIEKDVINRIKYSIRDLSLPESAEDLFKLFQKNQLPEKWIEEH